MSKVERMYPESKSALIKWIEDNFHDIGSFSAGFCMVDGTTMVIYEAESYIEAVGLAAVQQDTFHALGREGDFIARRRPP